MDAFLTLLAEAQQTLKATVKASGRDESKIVEALREELAGQSPEMQALLIELAQMPDIKPSKG